MSEIKMPAVEDLIPHRQRMKLIEEIVCLDEDQNSMLARTRIKDDWPMCQDGQADSIICVEVVAQAVACRHGLVKKSGAGARNMGFLVGVKSTRMYQPTLAIGTELQVTVTYLYGVDEYHAYSGTVSADSLLVCEAVVQVLSPDQAVLNDILSEQGQGGLQS